MKKITPFILFFFVFFLTAQDIKIDALTSDGGRLDNASYSASFTLGQPIVGNISNPINIIRQGFQQPFGAMQMSNDGNVFSNAVDNCMLSLNILESSNCDSIIFTAASNFSNDDSYYSINDSDDNNTEPKLSFDILESSPVTNGWLGGSSSDGLISMLVSNFS